MAAGLATAAGASADTLVGAGSSFDFPFFSRAFFPYHQDHPDVTVNYQSIGSGGGIQQFTAKTVDFGASDVPLTKTEAAAAQAANGAVVQVPVALGGVVIAYNVPGVSGHLKLSPGVLADIFLGKISNWNDSRIARLNPGVNLPNLPILVVHRADGSGTTYIFTDYLSRISADWKSKVGTAKSVSWPAASSVGVKGNEGVARQIRNTPGAIGYVELAYAHRNGHPVRGDSKPERQLRPADARCGARRGRAKADGEPDEFLDRRSTRRGQLSDLRLLVGHAVAEPAGCRPRQGARRPVQMGRDLGTVVRGQRTLRRSARERPSEAERALATIKT